MDMIYTIVNISNEFLIFLMFIKVIPIPSKFFINPFRGHSLCTRPNVAYSSIKLRKIKFFPESRRIHKIKSEDLLKFVQTPFFRIISAQLLANDVVGRVSH